MDGSFDIEYDDGEQELRVAKLLIKWLSSGAGGERRQDSGAAIQKRPEEITTETNEGTRGTPRLQRPTPIAVKHSRSFTNLTIHFFLSFFREQL
jgi:hypothetical protein